MTTAEVNTYIELNKLFQETCDHIAELFSKYNEEFNDRIGDWHIVDNEVFGTNRYVNGWYSDDDKIEVNFGIRCLSMSDGELKDYAEKFIAPQEGFEAMEKEMKKEE